MANTLFNSVNFIRDLPPILRGKRVTLSIRDTLNEFIFQRRGLFDPNFVIPSSNTTRWQQVEPGDSDEAILTNTEKNNWIDGLIGHLQAIFNNILNNNEQREFAI